MTARLQRAHAQLSGDRFETRNKAVGLASFDAWKAGTGSPHDLMAEDATWTIVGRSAASRLIPSRMSS
jgi:hypothetical protein